MQKVRLNLMLLLCLLDASSSYVASRCVETQLVMQPFCPVGFLLMNGLCYQAQQQQVQLCPEGYSLVQNICYRTAPFACDGTTTSNPVELTTVSVPPPTSMRCPMGSVYKNARCRKIYCKTGEYYRGECLQPACPDGTVWSGVRCQPPNFVTTILQIENIFMNQINSKHNQSGFGNENNVKTSTTTAKTYPIVTTTTTTPTTSNNPFNSSSAVSDSTTTPTPPPPKSTPSAIHVCCSIVTPRICKLYGVKWVCFNRRYRRCDPDLCHHQLIYLKTPKIVYHPPVLIMPPNPPLQVCPTENCDMDNTVDCSGCAHNRREACSPYCYRYMCPHNECSYIEQEIYCKRYPGESGCTEQDGCIWDWCGEKCD